jgi:hypothetical protein
MYPDALLHGQPVPHRSVDGIGGGERYRQHTGNNNVKFNLEETNDRKLDCSQWLRKELVTVCHEEYIKAIGFHKALLISLSSEKCLVFPERFLSMENGTFMNDNVKLFLTCVSY